MSSIVPVSSGSITCFPRFTLSACLALVFFGLASPLARGGFIGDYALAKFTLTNSVDAAGFASSPDGGLTLILTGPNTGSGSAGTTDFTIKAAGTGLVQFDYRYSTLDEPGFDYAGYILESTFYPLADQNGQSASVAFPVVLDQRFGFRVGSLDNTGEPGILSLTAFSAPAAVVIPEPASFLLFLAGAGGLWALRRGRMRAHRPQCAPASGRGSMLLAVLLSLASSPLFAQDQVVYSGKNVTGQLFLKGVVNLRQLAAVARTQGPSSQLPEKTPKAPPRRLRPAPLLSYSAQVSAAAQTARSLSVASATGSFGFPGLSHFDQREADGGNQWSIEPPNVNIAAANGYILQGVNTAVNVYQLTGAPALPVVVTSNQLFGLPRTIDRFTGIEGPYLTDMRVFHDQGINRFFVLQRSQDNDPGGNLLNSSKLYLAVSRTGDPGGDYNIYVMDTTNAQNPGCPCVDDYPQIGSDQYGFHIAWNEFTTYSERFIDAAILSVSKASLASGVSAPTAYRFLLPLSTGFEFALQPASTPPGATDFLASGGLTYFVSTRSTFSSGDRVALWAMTNTSSLATPAPNPILVRSFVSTLPYSYPDAATQKPGPLPYGASLTPPGQLALIDGGDCRVQSVSYAGGRLFLTFQSGVADEQSRQVVGGMYVVLAPTYRSGQLRASVLNQGYILVNNAHILRPSLAVNAQGRGAIAATLVGPAWHPSAAFIPFDTFTTPSVLNVASPGTLPADGFSGYPGGFGIGIARWGDYNSAVAASDGSIWMAIQYVGTFQRTEFSNWNTYITRTVP